MLIDFIKKFQVTELSIRQSIRYETLCCVNIKTNDGDIDIDIDTDPNALEFEAHIYDNTDSAGSCDNFKTESLTITDIKQLEKDIVTLKGLATESTTRIASVRYNKIKLN